MQEVEKRDPEWKKLDVRCCHGILWVQSTCSVIMEPISLRIFLSMSLDDVLITIDKTELV